MKIEYIRDNQVDRQLDRQIRKLLSSCFTDSDEKIFRHQRYFIEVPTHRYLLKDSYDELVAHVAVHDKQVFIENNPVSIAGVSEVCVHPLYRKKGYVRKLLCHVHRDIESRDVSYSVLFGEKSVYQSSGYHEVENLYVKQTTSVEEIWQSEPAMIREITRPWPVTFPVKLEGITF
ncbi:GNAT family N-acetyltransferase [Vibrio sp. SCSIO 43137]|uniref:GNAT family N-acetyltransferase n=1 Tax=Vibrio sp. SCSIO 43137 TaxID=3021011 RepID=UPI002307707A|nr:GNAT family N-acetyltransferase [Vibrio sp. SCSIO 43137]WCE28581.1 GNAT family N-acetyltransferase [Vibrio sp. SCSIO 43137]